jgi:hypothetical protein
MRRRADVGGLTSLPARYQRETKAKQMDHRPLDTTDDIV